MENFITPKATHANIGNSFMEPPSASTSFHLWVLDSGLCVMQCAIMEEL